MQYPVVLNEHTKEGHYSTGEIARLIDWLGDNPERDGLKRTPERFLNAMVELTRGYHEDPHQPLRTQFEEPQEGEYGDLVICRDIEIYSLCEHHLLPFFGRAHIGYIPHKSKIVGLSKLARCTEIYARRLQVQERLTREIRAAIDHVLEPSGAIVVLDCCHLCMRMRGVNKQNSQMVTSSVSGVFSDDHAARAEFLQLIKGGAQ